ncbi:MAG: hypothetical protein R3335_09560, partial [Anaerolineales bacterium]|nr:hypothetical protein [Anaerolineales bacterium]
MIDLDNSEIQFAISTVQQAALLARAIRREVDVVALSKEDYSPVTIADFACQAVVAARLEERFPDDVLVAEEDSQAFDSPPQEAVLELVTSYSSR